MLNILLNQSRVQSLDNNTHAFLALVRAGLWEEDVQLDSYGLIDYKDIYRLAQEQAVVGLVAAGLEHVVDVEIPHDIALLFVGETLQIEQRNKEMNSFIARTVEVMREKDIYTILLKGQGIAQCYEKPLWRAPGDIDLFLSVINYDKAKEFFKPFASRVETEFSNTKHLGMCLDKWVVELHGNLRCNLSHSINVVLDEILKKTFYEGEVRSWINNGSNIFLLSADNDILYVFTHFLNHFYKGGVGLRQICDWVRLLREYSDIINKSLLEKRLCRMGVMREWKAFGSFAVNFLGTSPNIIPMYAEEKNMEKKASLICSYILDVGNFGHNRDSSFYTNDSYLTRKFKSFRRICSDLFYHSKIFPMDTIKFFPYICYKGLQAAVRRE